jgi:hypothetical protein
LPIQYQEDPPLIVRSYLSQTLQKYPQPRETKITRGDEVKYWADLPGPGQYKAEKLASIESKASKVLTTSFMSQKEPKVADRFKVKKNVFCKEWARDH